MGMEYSTEAAGVTNSRREGPSPAVLVISGPSGVGKGTLIELLMTENPESFGFSVSHTTRTPRDGEQVGDGLAMLGSEMAGDGQPLVCYPSGPTMKLLVGHATPVFNCCCR